MIRRNIASNVAARAWGFISIYIFVPLYLKFIGIEAYGIVGFYSTLLGVLAFADMGFTATLNREMARLSVRKDSAKEMRDLLRTYETTYLCISSALAVLFWILAPLIVEHWLHAKGLPPRLLISTIRVMGVSIALELPSGLYIGGLMGLQKQVRANSIQIGWGVFRGVGAVLVLWFFSPTILAFALWQLLSNSIYCFAARLGLWSSLPSSPDNASPRFERSVFRSTWRYAAGMVGITIVSALLTQTDKLAVSKLLTLGMFGYYMIASSLASVPTRVSEPYRRRRISTSHGHGCVRGQRRPHPVLPSNLRACLRSHYPGRFDSLAICSRMHLRLDRLRDHSAAGSARDLSAAGWANHSGHHGGPVLFSACARQRQIEFADRYHLSRCDFTPVDCADHEIWNCGRWVVVADYEFFYPAALYVCAPSSLHARRTSEMGTARRAESLARLFSHNSAGAPVLTHAIVAISRVGGCWVGVGHLYSRCGIDYSRIAQHVECKTEIPPLLITVSAALSSFPIRFCFDYIMGMPVMLNQKKLVPGL